MTVDASTADRIERFLRDYPRGRLTVAVGYASLGGLAWLGRRCKGRRKVRVLIGNLEPHYFTSGSDSDRKEALAFVARRGVSVRAWRPSDRGAVAHLKVWLVQGRRSAALNGSANLSAGGLWKNEEMVTAVASSELETVVRKVEALFGDSRDASSQVRGYLGTGSGKRRKTRRRRSRSRRGRKPSTAGRVLQVTVGVAAIAGLLGSVAVGVGLLPPVRVPPMGGDGLADVLERVVNLISGLGVVGAAGGSFWFRRRGYRRRARRWAIVVVVIVVAYFALRFV